MKHFTLVLFSVIAVALVLESVNAAYHNGTRKTRQVKNNHKINGTYKTQNGLIKDVARGFRNAGNGLIKNGQDIGKNFGLVGGIANGVGDLVNYAINGTNDVIDDANNFVGDTAREIYEEGKNIIGTGDGDPIDGFFTGLGNIVGGAVDGATNIAGHIADGIGGAAKTIFG
ncbi:hypothetical protein CDAR_599871 [Caerostris darwini]|uniref:Uncharacterized protein n=1 Tax=Caerostris darwini TaxID=1538125 RepID=A0AAV4R6R4_9ARAC|nr:hypothetical protein CDAR_599871 [Caerostris darwini]